MNWWQKQVQEVLRKWKHNELSYGAALGELARLGYAPSAAGALLVRT